MNGMNQSGAIGTLLRMLEANAGVKLGTSDVDATFLELGLDSLFLTQFSVSVAQQFSIELTFRDLSTRYNSLSKLAAHIDSLRPPTPNPTGATVAREAALPTPASGSLPAKPRSGASNADLGPIVQLFLGQLDIMQQQLNAVTELMGDGPRAPKATAGKDSRDSGSADGPTGQPTSAGQPTPSALADLLASAQSAESAANSVEPQESPASAAPSRAGVAVFDASKPPVPGARLGKDANGKPAWFVPSKEQPGKYVKID